MRIGSLFSTLTVALLAASSCDSAPGRSSTREDPVGAIASARSPNRAITPASLFDDLVELARELAGDEYAFPSSGLPGALSSLTYDEYRAIQFRPESAIWSGESPFEVQLFHPGFIYPHPVRIHLVHEGEITELSFDQTLFEYLEAAAHVEAPAAQLANSGSATAGYAGFRIHYSLNSDASKDEVAVFLGASYFRLLGPGHAHGLSSRGLAVDVAEETGEEFPDFTAFWLMQPEAGAAAMTFFGLLEGPSVVGAYRFDLEPREQTVLSVETRLFARRDVRKLGVAPLTSMFLYGPDTAAQFDDYRAQVHDSEGLLMHTSRDEWIWRPLSNRAGVQVTSLRDVGPRGFGLVQRDRSFENYLDLEARYHRRPSQWVAVEGNWGVGGVELVELPTPSEFNDNIVAYWSPEELFQTGDERSYRYRLITFDTRLAEQDMGQVERMRTGTDALPGKETGRADSLRRFVVDFRGGVLETLDPSEVVTASLATSSGEVSEPVVQRLPDELGHRATFNVQPDGRTPTDMTLFLEVAGRRVSETWSYLWVPERDR